MRLCEHVEPVIIPAEGHVRVELIDAESGHVVDREEGHNFLSQITLEHARWWQRSIWSAFNPNEVTDAFGFGPMSMPVFPGQHIAYWNDASAENPLTETHVKSDLVGWASRHAIGSPSGKRGVVNITESEASNSYAKWVFDWTTSQGNGTFQSIGWTRVDESTGHPTLRWPEDGALEFTLPPGQTSNPAGGLYWDGSSWFALDISGSNCRIVSLPAAGGASSAVVVTIPTSAFSPTGNLQARAITKLGTDWIVVGRGSTFPDAPRVARISAAGTQVWAAAGPSGLFVYSDVTVDGSGQIWVTGTNGMIYRLDPANGSVTATVTPPSVDGGALTEMLGIAFDPSDSNFWVYGERSTNTTGAILKINSGGDLIRGLGVPRVDRAITSTAPFAGSYYLPAAGRRDPYVIQTLRNSTTLANGGYMSRLSQLPAGWSWPQALAMKGSELWAGSGLGVGTVRATPVIGSNLATRIKLSEPKIKTNAQNLKITYTFNF